MRSATPTIVLIHGSWLTPRSLEKFRKYYEVRGFRVLAPAWPGISGDVEQVRQDPAELRGLGIAEIVNYYDKIVRKLDTPPILIGHSLGGLVVQILLDRGLGAAGVAMESVAPQGIISLPFSPSTLKSISPVLLSPTNYWRTVDLNFEEFRFAFANTMDEIQAIEAFERYSVPGPGRPIFQVATANLHLKPVTYVNYRNGRRAPLLLIAGGADHLIPAQLTRENFRKYARSEAITELKEFENRSHLITVQEGWQEVAEFALAWSSRQASARQLLLAARETNARPRLSAIFAGFAKGA